MTDKLKIRLWCRTNKIGSKCQDVVPLIDYGFTDKEWLDLEEEVRVTYLNEWALEFMNNNGEIGAIVE